MRISKNIKKAIVISFSFFLLLGCINNKEAKVKGDILVKVNYLSFSICTYSAVTIATIENMTMKSIYLTDKEVENIYSVLKKVSPAPIFTGGRVRLKIDIPTREMIYIQKDGIAQVGKTTRKIDINGLKKLEKILGINLGSSLLLNLK